MRYNGYTNVTLQIFEENALVSYGTYSMLPIGATPLKTIEFYAPTTKRGNNYQHKFADNVARLVSYGYYYKLHIAYDIEQPQGVTTATAKKQLVKWRKEQEQKELFV